MAHAGLKPMTHHFIALIYHHSDILAETTNQGACMLILTRATGQSIKIGDEVTITVQSIRGNQVVLGIDAPKDVPVHREEIYERIQADKRKLAKSQ